MYTNIEGYLNILRFYILIYIYLNILYILPMYIYIHLKIIFCEFLLKIFILFYFIRIVHGKKKESNYNYIELST